VRPAAGRIHCRIHCRSGARTGRADVHGSAGRCVGPSQPAGTQLRLETLLSHHAVLTINLMRARLRGDPDLAQAAVAAVSKNTDDMTAVIDSIAGHELAAS
jgi:hypothetical protein